MPVIHIDGVEHTVAQGQNLLQACLSLGLNLPYFCWHPAMGSIGACRQCAVLQYQNAEDQHGRLVMSCMTPVSDGARFSLAGENASTFRRSVVESLMLNHPHDCPVCAEGGECHLQDMTVMTGHRDRRYRGRKNTHRNQYLGPLINHEMNRCITCYRCTRFYNGYAGGTDLSAQACHDHTYFGRQDDGVLQSEFAGNLVEVCPTGVFTDKTLVHDYTRKWDLQSAPSLCTGCAVGCNTLVGSRYGKVKRVHNRFNAEVNGYFLCDRGRFGAGFVNDEQRLEYPGLRQPDGRFNAIDHHTALQQLAEYCERGKIAAVGSPRASVEANYLLRTLVGPANFSPGFAVEEQPLVMRALQRLQTTPATIPDIATIETADAVLILGEDVTNTAPRIALALRQSVRNKAHALAAAAGLQSWQDAAIRNLAQQQRSPLFIASVAASRLDDVAEATVHLAPADIARLGFAVARLLADDAAHAENENENENQNQNQNENNPAAIANALRTAERPLIIAGTGCADTAIVDAAAEIAASLCSAGKAAMLCLVVPEANSLGQALLTGPEAPDLAELANRARDGNIDTLVILENDIYRRDSPQVIDELLQHIPHVTVLDGLDNATLSACELALPAASFAESEGTLVSLEGRAQRYFPAFQPAAERRASWIWLLALLKELDRPEVAELHHFDDITAACATELPVLAGITAAAPDHHYRNLGMRIPRQPPRYSGRTAMHANISMHEPKQPEDEETPFAFSMEGLNRDQPGALLPYVWAPGWSSNQSLHKFQAEVGGPLKGGTAGQRLLPGQRTGHTEAVQPPAFTPRADRWQLVPRHCIFGSDELSARSPGLSELVPHPYIELSAAAAAQLGVSEGDGIAIAEPAVTLEVRLVDSIAEGCAGYSAGLEGTQALRAGQWVELRKAAGWQRPRRLGAPDPTDVIGSDRGRHV